MYLNESGTEIVEHHVKYKELDGYDETIWMTKGEHMALHKRLRREGKCNIPVNELRKISDTACSRTDKKRKYSSEYYHNNVQFIDFTETLAPNTQFHDRIKYNHKTGMISYASRFRCINGYLLPVIDVGAT